MPTPNIYDLDLTALSSAVNNQSGVISKLFPAPVVTPAPRTVQRAPGAASGISTLNNAPAVNPQGFQPIIRQLAETQQGIAAPATQQPAAQARPVIAAPAAAHKPAPGTAKPRKNVISSIATPPAPIPQSQPASPVIAGVQIEPGAEAASPNVAAQRIANQADLNNGKYFYTNPNSTQPRSNSYTIGFNGDAPNITSNGRIVPQSAPTTAAEDEAGARTVDEIRGRMPGFTVNDGKESYDFGGIERTTPQNKADAYNASIKGLSDKFTAGEANTLPKNTIALLAEQADAQSRERVANINKSSTNWGAHKISAINADIMQKVRTGTATKDEKAMVGIGKTNWEKLKVPITIPGEDGNPIPTGETYEMLVDPVTGQTYDPRQPKPQSGFDVSKAAAIRDAVKAGKMNRAEAIKQLRALGLE